MIGTCPVSQPSDNRKLPLSLVSILRLKAGHRAKHGSNECECRDLSVLREQVRNSEVTYPDNILHKAFSEGQATADEPDVDNVVSQRHCVMAESVDKQ